MTTDYGKKTNADLVEILKSRSLPHNGKKADLVSRLQDDDSKNAGSAPAPAAKADAADDVIDWEDDEVTADGVVAQKASTEAGAAAIEAGGKGQVSNPAAVPNQKLDTNPAATSDLKVEATGGEAGKEGSEVAPAEGTAPAGEAEEKPAVNYAKGLPITEMEEELKKRKARAEKFGITEDSQTAIAEAEKQLERAKRFGVGADPNTGAGVKKLDEALPQEKPRKRGSNDQDGGRGGKRRNFGGRNRRQGGNRNRREGGNNNNNSGRSNGQAVVTEQDRAAMESRAKRFGAAA